MKNLKHQKIEWKTPQPTDFPCSVCKKRYAEYFLEYSNNIITAKLPVCKNCKEISVDEFEKCVFGKEL